MCHSDGYFSTLRPTTFCPPPPKKKVLLFLFMRFNSDQISDLFPKPWWDIWIFFSTSFPLVRTRWVWSTFTSLCSLSSKQRHWLTPASYRKIGTWRHKCFLIRPQKVISIKVTASGFRTSAFCNTSYYCCQPGTRYIKLYGYFLKEKLKIWRPWNRIKSILITIYVEFLSI